MDESGIEYDLQSDGRSFPSKPHLIRENGKVVRIVAANSRQTEQILSGLKRKDPEIKYAIPKATIRDVPFPPLRKFSVNIGPEMRQLAVKMCVAVGRMLAPDVIVLGKETREFLLAEAPATSPVRQDHSIYTELDKIRAPLAHSVYIECSSESGRCFGVVQFFGGVFQFYVPLVDKYIGRDLAMLGTLDIRKFHQSFRKIKSLKLPEAPQFINSLQFSESAINLTERFNAQVMEAYGKNTILLNASPTQSLSGLRYKVPLLWIENELRIQLSIDLSPDKPAEGDVTFNKDPNLWTISPDEGGTKLMVFDQFVESWNKKLLDRATTAEHTYVPPEIVPGVKLLLGENYWCPIDSMTLRYRVLRRAWLGSIVMADTSAEIDHSKGEMRVKVQITEDVLPKNRDVSWPEIGDPNKIERESEALIVLERSDLDATSLKFDEFSVESVKSDR